ncbi:hypothetical protein DsansV1_C10g0102751 [Dioscorea sansibarensis]
MASLKLSSSVLKNPVLPRSPYHNSGFSSNGIITFPRKPFSNNLSLRCTAALPLKAISPCLPINGRQSIIKRCNIIDPQEVDALAPEEEEEDDDDDHAPVGDSKEEEEEEPFRLFKWPIQLIGPSVLLMTAMAPTLWLPLPSVFKVMDLAGFLSPLGLDCVFNTGATFFFLVADAYGRPKRSLEAIETQIPLSNKVWNTVANTAGFVLPLMMLLASSTYVLRPPLPFFSFLVMLAPYLLMLAVQIVAEVLTWTLKSPAWLVVPVVYEVYRLFQLRRAIRLAALLGAPVWSIEGLLVLVSVWLFLLVVQLLRVAWFSGYAAKSQRRLPV